MWFKAKGYHTAPYGFSHHSKLNIENILIKKKPILLPWKSLIYHDLKLTKLSVICMEIEYHDMITIRFFACCFKNTKTMPKKKADLSL